MAWWRSPVWLVPTIVASAAGLIAVLAIRPSATTAPVAVAAADYYVATGGSDHGDGGRQAPWRTIRHAAAVVTAGATVHVAPGRYAEDAISVPHSGTAAAPITFVSDSPHGAIVAGSSWRAFDLTGDHVTISGFEILMTDPARASAIIETHGSHETITGNLLHDAGNRGHECHGGGAVDVYTPSDGDVITGNTISHVGLPVRCSHGGMHGIYLGGTNHLVANNVIWDVKGNCIQAWPYLSRSRILNNDVDHCGTAVDGPRRDAGITIGNDGGGHPTDHNVIANNIATNVTGWGIRECCTSPGSVVGRDERYASNDLFRNTTAGILVLSGSRPAGTLSVDPQYASWPAAGGGDYHLRPTSPLVDAGAGCGAPAADLDGAPRPRGGGWDVGAYESPARP